MKSGGDSDRVQLAHDKEPTEVNDHSRRAAPTRAPAHRFGLVPVDESDPDFARYDAGGVLFALHAIPTDIAKTIEISEPPRRRSDTAIKYTFHVDDVPAVRARLAAHGVTMSEPRTFGSRTFCDGVDPEGNVFQIANG